MTKSEGEAILPPWCTDKNTVRTRHKSDCWFPGFATTHCPPQSHTDTFDGVIVLTSVSPQDPKRKEKAQESRRVQSHTCSEWRTADVTLPPPALREALQAPNLHQVNPTISKPLHKNVAKKPVRNINPETKHNQAKTCDVTESSHFTERRHKTLNLFQQSK